MNVIFRVDASNLMGTGHLMRSLTLAEALRYRGAEIRFICRAHPGNLIELLHQQAFPVSILSAPLQITKTHREDYALWLGVTQAEDAEQTIEALDGERAALLIVDHYGLDSEWEQKLRSHTAKIMVIDDLAYRRHDCDFLLDQNYSEAGEDRYRKLVPENCRLLLGPRYALLRPEYAVHRQTLRPRDGQLRRVLVFFGGPDPDNMTGLAIEALSAPEYRHLEVDVVVGASNLHRAALEVQSSARRLTNLYGSQPHLADLMTQADLAIGAGGATTWERMCLGLPSIVITLSENQIPISKLLAERGLIRLIGHAGRVGVSDICDALREESHAPEYGLRSLKCMAVCDGIGAKRVVDILVSETESALKRENELIR